MDSVKLTRNLRKNILRGHPWVYPSAFDFMGSEASSSKMVKVKDSKGAQLAWGIFDPSNDIGLRILSLESKPPGVNEFKRRLKNAFDMRESFMSAETNCGRLVNGEGDLLPGMVIDRYDDVCVIQFDGQGMAEFWMDYPIKDWLLDLGSFSAILHKSRHLDSAEFIYGDTEDLIAGEGVRPGTVLVSENGVRFAVDVVRGQKTGFFLDQRNNRQYLKQFVKSKSVLNLFSYTGGFSIYSGVAGAKKVTSVDIAKAAIDDCQVNWSLNDLSPDSHSGVAKDCHEFLKSSDERFDVIVVDPPSMAPSEKAKPQAIEKYIKIFGEAAKKVNREGHLILSSCSSHISFEDFNSIVEDALGQARKTAQILRISGQGCDHPFPHFCPELRYLKFYHLRIF